jgi:hypothetical protein
MPDNEDRAPAAGAGDAGALESTARLVDEVVDALLGQIRRAARQSETARDLPRGTKKALKELADDASSIEGHTAELLAALGAEQAAENTPRVPAACPRPPFHQLTRYNNRRTRLVRASALVRTG